jgi:hypothetical protein
MLLNFKNLTVIGKDKENNIYVVDSPIAYPGPILAIGTYSTEEKALKVLDMIEENYRKVGIAKIGGLNCYEVDYSFQMPADTDLDEQEVTEVTETEKELEDALNSVKNYKNMLFGGCNGN